MTQEIAVGAVVDVKKSVDVPVTFTGTVQKLYANAALVSIDTFDSADAVAVEDLKHKTVINYKAMTQDGKPVKAPKLEDTKK